MIKGRIASWNDDKGFGFIQPNDGGQRTFVHINAFTNRNTRPEVGDAVTYSLTKDSKGRTRATNVARPGEKRVKRASKGPRVFSALAPVLFLTAVGASAELTSLPYIVPAAYLVVSLITYLVYAWDKASAKAGRWRTSEGTLHILALVGGWPGAMLAQRILRHKTKKASFRPVFWTTVLLNCAGLVWLHTPEGNTSLDQVLTLIGLVASSIRL